MTMADQDTIEVRLSRRFIKDSKQLQKKYRHLADDVEGLIAQLERGETPGDPLQGIGIRAYKVRLKSSDVERGKSGGFRVIYYIRVENTVVLLTIYIKSEQENILSAEIVKLIREHEALGDAQANESADETGE